MQTPVSVSTLNNQIKALLETHYLNVLVEGEASRVTYHSSGHLYFTLKDDKSAISCVMFKSNNRQLKFRLEEGMQIIVSGGVTVYTPRGSYQINCSGIEPAGSGALALAYEQLKEKLQQKGYFASERKKPLPPYPSHIVIVTSKTGAAIQDMYRVAKKRWPLLKITLIDTLVQGEGAANAIARNIALADRLDADVIVVGRGGGSLEDLWAFNEEIVADAIYAAKTPVVSAVGHEIDFLISDFVADLRAPTPSAAMELILPDQNEVLMQIDNLIDTFTTTMRNLLHKRETAVTHLLQLFAQNSLEAKLARYHEEIAVIKTQMDNYFQLHLQRRAAILSELLEAFNQNRPDKQWQRYEEVVRRYRNQFHDYFRLILDQKTQTLTALRKAYENNDPAKRDQRGFAQISKNGKTVALESLEPGDRFSAQNSKVSIEAEVKQKRSL